MKKKPAARKAPVNKRPKALNGRVRACSACGSNELKWASGGSDSYLDAIGDTNSGLFECGSCGRMVPAIEFDSESGRAKFAKLLKMIKGNPNVPRKSLAEAKKRR